jgi:hypothetical protein
MTTIPCATRSRPIYHVMPYKEGIPVFTNNINSPGLFHVSTFMLQQEAFRASAVTCMMSHPKKILTNYSNCGFDLCCSYVSFWSEVGPLMTVEVYIPSHWSPRYFLYELQAPIVECSIISLTNTYTLNGTVFPFLSINSIHNNYLTR